MKKFLICVAGIFFAAIIWDTAHYRLGFYIDLNKGKEIETFTSVDGQEILVDTGKGLMPYEIKGVDMGVGIPGHFATEFAIDKETYLRWFRMIQDMGANTVRVYTILSSSFYEAVYEYNEDNPSPLYILHGVWVDDYVLNSHVDAYDDAFFDRMKKDCRALVDVLHGNKKLNLGRGSTGGRGFYKKDISPWVLGYILGVEWEDVTVAYTDHMQKDRNEYHGTYMYTTEDATAFEALLAAVGDDIIRYETEKYKQQRLVAFSNWSTTDPFDYPEVIRNEFRKVAKVDAEHIGTTEHFISGQFASYHIYPYYPEYLRYFDTWKEELPYADDYLSEDGVYNTYGVYLAMINQHHSMPVLITEFGVPASRGRAQTDVNTNRSQGNMSEEEQGEALRSCYEDIKQAGCAGSVIFTWQDEWFKRTWNTMANVDLSNTAYWSDYQTNEQYYGMLAFDPGNERSVCYVDGDMEEWSTDDLLINDKDYRLYTKYDEKFLYFRVYRENLSFGTQKSYIPIDVTPKSGSYFADGENVKFTQAADFLIVLDGEKNSRVLVQSRYDAFRAMFWEIYEGENPHINPPEQDSPVFHPIRLILKVEPNEAQISEQDLPIYETGLLTYGNANPNSGAYNSLADFIVNGDNIEMRIPWQLLNFSNPSNMSVHDDYYERYGIEHMSIDGIYVGFGAEQDAGKRIGMRKMELKGWEKNVTYHERLKPSYYVMQSIWAVED